MRRQTETAAESRRAPCSNRDACLGQISTVRPDWAQTAALVRLRRGSLIGQGAFRWPAVTPSEPEFANARLVEAEVVTHLVTHRVDDVCSEARGIVSEVAYECVAKNQDLVWHATAPEEGGTTELGADVHAIRVVLGATVGDDDGYVLQRLLELGWELVERRANELLKFLLAVVPGSAHGFVIAPSVAHPLRSRAHRISVSLKLGSPTEAASDAPGFARRKKSWPGLASADSSRRAPASPYASSSKAFSGSRGLEWCPLRSISETPKSPESNRPTKLGGFRFGREAGGIQTGPQDTWVLSIPSVSPSVDHTSSCACLGGMLRRTVADTIELPRDRWRSYFDDLSRGLATMQATVEIDGPGLGAQVQAEGLVLSGMSYDDRDDVLVVGLSPGGATESLEHLVSSPQRIRVESSDAILPSTIQVEDAEGQRTRVRLQAAPALPAE